MENMEIERKFLVDLKKLELLNNGVLIKQGYVFDTDKGVLRVRNKGSKYFLTIKNKPAKMLSKMEIEFEISKEQGELLFQMTDNSISKIRHEINYKGKIWEVDVFQDKLSGFVMAEIELNSVEEEFELPQWVGIEVTEDKMFQNSNLIKTNKNTLLNHIKELNSNKFEYSMEMN
jgi:adenylate cyclase